MIKKLSVILLAFALTACAGDEEPSPVCPQVAIVKDLALYVDYGRPDGKATQDDLVGQAMLIKQADSCSRESNGLKTDITLKIIAKRGPRLGQGGLTVPYFIAVLDAGDKIVAKDVMSATLTFGKPGQAQFADELSITLPPDATGNFPERRIWIGFQLSPEQVEQSRTANSSSSEAANDPSRNRD